MKDLLLASTFFLVVFVDDVAGSFEGIVSPFSSSESSPNGRDGRDVFRVVALVDGSPDDAFETLKEKPLFRICEMGVVEVDDLLEPLPPTLEREKESLGPEGSMLIENRWLSAYNCQFVSKCQLIFGNW